MSHHQEHKESKTKAVLFALAFGLSFLFGMLRHYKIEVNENIFSLSILTLIALDIPLSWRKR